jgi:hypothetical protein
MDENELLEKLYHLKETLGDLVLRRAGWLSRLEGVQTELEVGLRPERAGALLAEFLELRARLDLIQIEQQALSDWTKENLPSEFHLTLDD